MAAASAPPLPESAAPASTGTSKASRQRPHVNLFDMPELLPGAGSSANPAKREAFEQRCRQLHRDSMEEAEERTPATKPSSASATTLADLEVMFPTLDADLIRAICADVAAPQLAVDTLLVLAASSNDNGGERAPTPPPLKLGFEDHNKFPSLIDAEGWQVAATKDFERDPEEELGSGWRDRAKAAADIPAPRVERPLPAAWGAEARRRRQKDGEAEGYKKDEGVDPVLPETDYESRHRLGQARAKNRALYGRGRAGGKGSGRGGAPTAKWRADGDASEGEASDDQEDEVQ